MPPIIKKAKPAMVNVVPPKEKYDEPMPATEYQPSGPTIWLDKDVSGITDQKVGNEFTIVCKVKLKSKEEREDDKRGKRMSYHLEIREMGVE